MYDVQKSKPWGEIDQIFWGACHRCTSENGWEPCRYMILDAAPQRGCREDSKSFGTLHGHFRAWLFLISCLSSCRAGCFNWSRLSVYCNSIQLGSLTGTSTQLLCRAISFAEEVDFVECILEGGGVSPFPIISCRNIYILPGIPSLLQKKWKVWLFSTYTATLLWRAYLSYQKWESAWSLLHFEVSARSIFKHIMTHLPMKLSAFLRWSWSEWDRLD